MMTTELETLADRITNGLRDWVTGALRPMRARISTIAARQDLIEGRVAEIGDTRAKAWTFVGLYKRDTLYDESSVCTWDGSSWIAERATQCEPGNGNDWRILAMRGRSGKSAGERGPPGPKGDLPRHKWIGTSLAFEQGPDGGEFGVAVDLQGPPGRSGTITAMGLAQGAGGSGSSTTTQFSYFPAGWA